MNPRIEIPPRLRQRLATHPSLQAAVDLTLDDFSAWAAQHTQLTFFPEYTDHGPDHISAVLATTEKKLIPAEVFDLLSAEDAATYVLAVLLHDYAMQLTKEGFLRLVSGQSPHSPILELGDRPWPLAWEDFRAEASRFSGTQNQKMFGSTEPVPAPTLDLHATWSTSQHMLIGEFIRRHHAPLAHQMALHGFPGAGREAFRVNPAISSDISNIAGLVARSHGIALRPCVDYLQQRYRNRVDRFNIHAVYLMCLLRVGDYLQIDHTRASHIRLRVQSLRSPTSMREIAKHAATVEVSHDQNDPESLDVFIRPESVDIYLAMRDLTKDLQREIDDSWAILGEAYGRQDRGLDKLGLRIRRIRTTFEEPLPFIPDHFRFRLAEVQLLRLLIKPLYGDDPNIGFREVLQNAIDAVRERNAWCSRRDMDPKKLDLPKQDADVVVTFETLSSGETVLVIADAGIGMTPETVRDYYLRVGASFRNSSAWKKEFADDAGAAQVLRTGRFGIGALASFLLGEEIEVSTRHVTAPKGIRFRTSIDSDPIEVTTCGRPIGTTLRIFIRGKLPRLDENLYVLADPSVRFVSGSLSGASGAYPGAHDPLPPEWQRVPDIENPTILWPRDSMRVTNWVTINGIVVERGDDDLRRLCADGNGPFEVLCPRLHIFDWNGSAPLNLSRTEFLLGEFAGVVPLAQDILRDFLAFLLVRCPTYPPRYRSHLHINYPYVKAHPHKQFITLESNLISHRPPWMIVPDGLALVDEKTLDRLGIESLHILPDCLDLTSIPSILRGAILPIEGSILERYRRIEEQGALSPAAGGLEGDGDGACPPVELPIGQMTGFDLALVQKGERPAFRTFCRPRLQNLGDQIGQRSGLDSAIHGIFVSQDRERAACAPRPPPASCCHPFSSTLSDFRST